jgi:segregation and condensation protein A
MGTMQNPGEGAPWPDGEGPLRGDPLDEGGEALIVDVEGFEGPLDLLLALARTQKVDLARVSILALAEQYLSFIANTQRLRLDLAADYLVMAAWLAYLKSRLLLPDASAGADSPAAQLAQHLAFRLRRLEAMREAGALLMARSRLGRDVFGRGRPEPLQIAATTRYADGLHDLLQAYVQRRQHAGAHRRYHVPRLPVWTIQEARAVLDRLIGGTTGWGRFDTWLAQFLRDPKHRPTVIASSFAASLEMAREGAIEIRQDKPFAPIYLRRNAATT